MRNGKAEACIEILELFRLRNPFLPNFLTLEEEEEEEEISIKGGKFLQDGFRSFFVNESRYKRKLRNIVGGWSEAYEVTRGSGFGYPDLQFLVDGVLLPVEVKVGVVKGDRIFPKAIRPSQIVWHDRFKKAGGVSVVLVCCGSLSAMDCWAAPGTNREILAQWRKGWPTKQCRQWIKGSRMLINLLSYQLTLGQNCETWHLTE